MLVPEISESDHSTAHEFGHPERNHVFEQRILACVQVRSAVALYYDFGLTEEAYNGIGNIILKHDSTPRTTLTGITRQVMDMVERMGCSPLTVINAAYLVSNFMKDSGTKAGYLVCHRDPLKCYFVSLVISMSLCECSYYCAYPQIIRCRLHGSSCTFLASWLDKSGSLFNDIADMQSYEAALRCASRGAFPPLPSDLEYFAETYLAPPSSRNDQLVPNSLHHLLACLRP